MDVVPSFLVQLLTQGQCAIMARCLANEDANQCKPTVLPPLCRFVSILTPVRDVLNDVFAGYRPHLLANGSWPQQVGGG